VELVPFLLVGLLAVGGLLATHLHRQRQQRALERLVARDPGLRPTATPLDWDRHLLQATCAALPAGDRRYGLELAVEGPVTTTVAGERTSLPCAAFRWWWEERRRNQQHGHRYQTRRTTVACLRLPAPVPAPILIGPESVLGRLGVTRGGRQLESGEFNRRFRVECADDRFAVLLLDAQLQATLLEDYQGRTIELVGDVALLEGAPSHRDATLGSVVGQLPAVRQDLGRLVAALPDQLWRRTGLHAPRPMGSATGDGQDDGSHARRDAGPEGWS
jgi:hypothetical protein